MKIKGAIIIVGSLPISMRRDELPEFQGNFVISRDSLPAHVADWVEAVTRSIEDA